MAKAIENGRSTTETKESFEPRLLKAARALVSRRKRCLRRASTCPSTRAESLAGALSSTRSALEGVGRFAYKERLKIDSLCPFSAKRYPSLEVCRIRYRSTATGCGPEIVHFGGDTGGLYIKPADEHSLLRPETVESLFLCLFSLKLRTDLFISFCQ